MSKRKVMTVECSCCGGSGRREVTGVYLQTYNTVRSLIESVAVEFVIANRDCRHFGCRGTSLSNRLAWLQENGLLRGERFGRELRYFLNQEIK